jgi:hypothetical protein
MAKFITGINGPVQGKVGTVSGSSWKGISYLKGPYKKRTKDISDKEKANREKFALAHKWLSPLLTFVRVGFRGYSPTSEGFIAAKSYLLRNAVEISPDGFTINPSLMKVSFGDLPLSGNMSVTKTPEDKLQFTWDKSTPDGGNAHDQVMMLAYDTAGRHPLFVTNGQFRNTGTDTIPVSGEAGVTYHLYAAFLAVDRSRQSDSMYLGEMIM